MVLTYDVGSIPFPGEFEKFIKGSRVNPLLGLLSHRVNSVERGYFEDKVVEGFVDKIKVGISVPNYPQFRDMNEMFLNCIVGIAKTKAGYTVVDRIALIEAQSIIPEVDVIKERAREISERAGGPFKIKICVTGPYTLSSLFVGRESQLFIELGSIISKFIDSNIFDEKFSKVDLVAVDEPVFGFIDDPLLDYGQVGREDLLKAWENIFHRIKQKGVKSIIHLHKTTNDLFWNVKSLDIVESHVNDALYFSPRTKEYLEKSDKFLKASICITDLDNLIRNIEMTRGVTDEAKISQKIADTWTNIRRGRLDPILLLESSDMILDRLRQILRQYEERVLYAGPECGLESFPTYDSAIECLHRVAYAAQQLDLK